jgi:hypothetical protein
MVVYTVRDRGVRREVVQEESAPAPAGSEPTDIEYAPGSVYLVTDKGERRTFGSYYTPDHIVEHIVRETLGPLCRALTADSGAASNGADFAERVLSLRIVDPAMGSGHFLIRACQFLAEEIATNPHTAADPVLAGDATLAHWKRLVVERCLYGVDVNPMAVDLAKLALWLETVAADRPLTFLDHHLRTGNSLIGAKVNDLAALPGERGMYQEGFDAILARKLPVLLQPLAAIRDLPSESIGQVKEKHRLYHQFRRAAGLFWTLADLWVSAAAGLDLEADSYHEALEAVDTARRFAALARNELNQWAEAAEKALDLPFHWELAFPEVYFDGDHRRNLAGFDAVIGNPPYEVLSERESGHDQSALKAFIDATLAYRPSKGGKNNLYKLFICRALDLLADGGRLGFITPMPVLGDEQAAGVRAALFDEGGFAGVESFPQKDVPARRVFTDAKLSTAVWLYEKSEAAKVRPFRVRVHPANVIESDSPSLTLTTADVPIYDPVNRAIASCSQADWDLVTRIVKSGRIGRLGEFCTSYQGEVNETNEKQKCLSRHADDGPLVLRGANVCLYMIREASQGEAYYIDVNRFFAGKKADAKAHHSKEVRIGFQRSSPQNNFRRIIAAPIAHRNFCFDTISYVPKSRSKLHLAVVLALLNSRLLDWYFRLGSTNSKVNEYQFDNLPCPVFTTNAEPDADATGRQDRALTALRHRRTADAVAELLPLLARPPFSLAVQVVIVAAVVRIMAIERERGEIARTDRASLSPEAQPYQDVIDKLLYGMAGLTTEEVRGLEERYERML